MQEVLSELHRSQESGYNLRDEARTSLMNRAKICSKLIKYPNIEDYAVSRNTAVLTSCVWTDVVGSALEMLNVQLALREHDARQLYMGRQHVVDIKNIYAILTDLIHKNIKKVCYHIKFIWVSVPDKNDVRATPVKIRSPRGNNREAPY